MTYKLKVLLIDVNCKNGSTGKIVYDLHTELIKDGHKSIVCYGRGKKINQSGIQKISNDFEMYMHALLARVTGLNGYFSFFATWKLMRIIEDFKPDIVHIHDPKTYYLNLIQLLNYLDRKVINTIFTLHSEYLYTGKCGHSYDCVKWKTECGNCKLLRHYPKSLLFDFTRKMYRDKKTILRKMENLTVVTPSPWLTNRTKQSFLKEKKIYTIYNGINNEIFQPSDYSQLKRKLKLSSEKVVLTIAPNLMSDLKGGKWVLELSRRMRNQNVKFIMIGIDDLNQNFEDNIIPIGRIDNQYELAEYYSLADVTLLTSKRETFSLVLAESLCCGTPVVGFKAGAPEMITIKEFSEFVEYGNLDLLENIVSKWIKTDIASSQNISCLSVLKYSKETMYANYMKLYMNISKGSELLQ